MSTLRIPASRVILFVLLTAAALTVDLFSKSVVFNDLGYPGADPNPTTAGLHDRFSFPITREGESKPYLNGWMKFRLLTSFNRVLGDWVKTIRGFLPVSAWRPWLESRFGSLVFPPREACG